MSREGGLGFTTPGAEAPGRTAGQAARPRYRPTLLLTALASALVGLAAIWSGTLLAGALPADDSLEQRRARIEKMDPAAKEQLRRRHQRFDNLDAAERERLRRLHHEIERDPHTAELHLVMHRYYEWLKTLTPYQRAELRELAPEKRIERIKQLRQEQAQREAKRASLVNASRSERIKRLVQEHGPKGSKRPNPQDVEGLLRWIDEYGARYLQNLPAARREQLDEQLARIKDPARRREVVGSIWLRQQLENPKQLPPDSDRTLADLRSKLTPATRERLESMPAAEQWRTVGGLLRLLLLHHYFARRTGPWAPMVSEKELAHFLEEKLTPSQRDGLLSLPREEMQQKLWEMYVRSKWPDTPSRPSWPSRGRRPGGPKSPGADPPEVRHGPQPGPRPPSTRTIPRSEGTRAGSHP